ncbi:MAG: hypothetical protein ACMUJM_24255 [bacterium]
MYHYKNINVKFILGISCIILGIFCILLILNGIIRGYTWEKNGYEFISSLYEYREERGTFYIQINHPRNIHSDEKNVYISKIFTRINGVLKKRIYIDLNSITLILKNTKGETISFFEPDSSLSLSEVEPDDVQYYTQFYKIDNPPKKLIEYIEFNICIDNECKKAKWEFPLKYKLSLKYWEGLRSIYLSIKKYFNNICKPLIGI